MTESEAAPWLRELPRQGGDTSASASCSNGQLLGKWMSQSCGGVGSGSSTALAVLTCVAVLVTPCHYSRLQPSHQSKHFKPQNSLMWSYLPTEQNRKSPDSLLFGARMELFRSLPTGFEKLLSVTGLYIGCGGLSHWLHWWSVSPTQGWLRGLHWTGLKFMCNEWNVLCRQRNDSRWWGQLVSCIYLITGSTHLVR